MSSNNKFLGKKKSVGTKNFGLILFAILAIYSLLSIVSVSLTGRLMAEPEAKLRVENNILRVHSAGAVLIGLTTCFLVLGSEKRKD